MQIQYLPLLFIYFAYGLQGITSVLFTFLKKDLIGLAAADWSSIAIVAGLPWSIKMLFGSIIDGVNIFGNNRKSYVILASIIMLISHIFTVTAFYPGFMGLTLTPLTALLIAAFLGSTGFVLADIVADTMTIDLVKKDQDFDKNIAHLTVLTRLSSMVGAFIAALLSGYVAKLSNGIHLFTIIPLINLLAIPFIKMKPTQLNLNKKYLFLGLGYLVALIALFIFDLSSFSENSFYLTATVIGTLMFSLVKEIDNEFRKKFIYACIAIFLFRIIPAPVEPVQWYMIDYLKLDEMFFGRLRIISSVVGFFGLLLLKRTVEKADIAKTLIVCTLLDVALNIPFISVYYKWFSIDPKYILMLDSALSSPVGSIAMIPLSVLLARFVPENSRATYISVTASFVNLPLMIGDLITRRVNTTYVVTQTDFSLLGKNILTCAVISLLLSLIGIYVIRRK